MVQHPPMQPSSLRTSRWLPTKLSYRKEVSQVSCASLRLGPTGDSICVSHLSERESTENRLSSIL